MPAWGIVVIVIVALAVFGVGGFLHYLYMKKKREIAAMNPEEKELHDAEKEYAAMVKQAEKEHKATVKSLDKAVAIAQRAYQSAVDGVNRVLGKYGEVRLFEDRVETPDGVAGFEDGPVSVTVDTAGNIAVSKRITLTRLVAGGIIGGIIFPKKKVHDERELYLLVETPGFASMAACDPEHGAKVRQFAIQINNTYKNAPALKQEREQTIAQANATLEAARVSREQDATEADQRLEAIKQDIQRVDAARQAVSSSGTSSNEVLT